jgi:hypothetical protein
MSMSFPTTRLIAYTNTTRLMNMVGDIRQQSQVPRPLYRLRQGTLMPGAGTGFTAGLNLPPIRYVAAQLSRLFVVYRLYTIHTKRAMLAPGYIPSPAPSPPIWLGRILSSHN